MFWRKKIPIITNWQPFTPTVNWTTNTTASGFWRRVGDTLSARVMLDFTGAPDAGQLNHTIPFGLVVDSTKIDLSVGDQAPIVGIGHARDNATAAFVLSLLLNSATQIVVHFMDDGAAALLLNGGTFTNTSVFTIGNTDAVLFSYEVPIIGWG